VGPLEVCDERKRGGLVKALDFEQICHLISLVQIRSAA
jgi:hypothetical protein